MWRSRLISAAQSAAGVLGQAYRTAGASTALHPINVRKAYGGIAACLRLGRCEYIAGIVVPEGSCLGPLFVGHHAGRSMWFGFLGRPIITG